MRVYLNGVVALRGGRGGAARNQGFELGSGRNFPPAPHSAHRAVTRQQPRPEHHSVSQGIAAGNMVRKVHRSGLGDGKTP